MPFIAPELIIQAKQMDLLTYLRNYEPYELVKFSGNTYCTRTHDSLKISNGKWIWWSRGIGGRSALDYLIKVKGYSFLEAVETIIGHTAIQAPVYEKPQPKEENKPLLLPEKCASNRVITEYLFGRGIDFEIINYCISNDLIFESLPYHNVVFVGYDEKKEPKYAAYRSTNKRRIMGDCSGSKKDYSFRLGKENLEEVHLFECAIDLLSYATLAKLNGQDWKEMSFVSLSGVYSPAKKIEDSKVPIALEKYLGSNPSVRKIRIHFDNDIAGRKAAQTLKTILPDTVRIKSADGVCVKQDRIIRKPKGELRISRPSVQRSSFKNNRSILSENRASELWSVRRKQLNSLQGRQEIRQSRPYRKVQPILFRGRSRPQNKRQRLLLRPQKKLPL